MDFSFSLDQEEGKRQAFRTRVPGLTCRETGREPEYPVKDISATGLAFFCEEKVFSGGDELRLDLLINRRVYIGDIKARVIRIFGDGAVGAEFAGLDRRQEEKLDKLVLEVQKRMISMRKVKSAIEPDSQQDK